MAQDGQQGARLWALLRLLLSAWGNFEVPPKPAKTHGFCLTTVFPGILPNPTLFFFNRCPSHPVGSGGPAQDEHTIIPSLPISAALPRP